MAIPKQNSSILVQLLQWDCGPIIVVQTNEFFLRIQRTQFLLKGRLEVLLIGRIGFLFLNFAFMSSLLARKEIHLMLVFILSYPNYSRRKLKLDWTRWNSTNNIRKNYSTQYIAKVNSAQPSHSIINSNSKVQPLMTSVSNQVHKIMKDNMKVSNHQQ